MAFVSQHVVTIVARGGTGKTQVVLKFVYKNLSRFLHVWFFDATSDTTLAADFKKLGKAAGIGELVNDVRDFLGRMQEDWLLIFDNADDVNVKLSKYIPQCNHGNIIITSCLTKINEIASSGGHLDFSDLKQSEAVNLLLKHAHQDLDNSNQQLAFDIVDALGCQALAAATAGAYIASTATCTFSNYLSLFEQKSKQLLNYEMELLDGYQKTIFSAFQLSFDQLSSSTQLFMQICAFFHHTAIPVELFYHAAAFTGNDLQPEEKEKTPAVKELKDFLSLFTYEWSWDDSIDELSCFSLTTYNTGAKALSFHPILYKCIQETITNKDKAYHIALLLLARATLNDNTNINYQFQRLLIAHADCIYQDNFSTLLIYNCLDQIYKNAGLWKKAESIQQKALVYCEHYFGNHHLNILRFRSNLGWTYKECGQLEKAEMLEKETFKLCKEVLGDHHSDTLISMNIFALIYQEVGQLEKAEMLQKETLKIRKEVLGDHHSNTLISMGNLALIYQKLGQLEKAEMLQKETLKLCKEVLGDHHSSTLISMGHLALIYQKLGQLEKAEMLQKETLKLHKEVLGLSL
ncbi:P-loop containing nucleoside triphosphate hydrolase protein [Armillaria nabsnona]|nr:P-loop containing nucleoside triphosphate hydrolase protein [Armillaria nabsnona]